MNEPLQIFRASSHDPLPAREPPQHPLLIYPDPRLQIVCTPISERNPILFDVHALLADMWGCLRFWNGWGLSAPQIGSPVRAIICKVPGNCEIEIIDPVVVKRWGGKFYSDEGCLSWPGHTRRMCRDRYIKIEGFDRNTDPVAFGGKNHQAACIQHELDHLNGINLADP